MNLQHVGKTRLRASLLINVVVSILKLVQFGENTLIFINQNEEALRIFWLHPFLFHSFRDILIVKEFCVF